MLMKSYYAEASSAEVLSPFQTAMLYRSSVMFGVFFALVLNSVAAVLWLLLSNLIHHP